MGFLVICLGITILQMSKVDPVSLSKLDRRSTILLQAARSNTEIYEEKGAIGVEDPGMDALRGSFGTVGSIIRARSARRMSQSSGQPNYRIRPVGAGAPYDRESSLPPWPPGVTSSPGMHPSPLHDQLGGVKRHQLYDAPVPHDDANSSIRGSPMVGKRPTIKFDSQDVVHQYDPPGTGDDRKTEHRMAVGSPAATGYPPLPPLPTRFSDGLPTHSLNTSADLLGMNETVPLTHGESSGSNDKQTLELPSSRFANDNEVHSAPPTVNHRFARPGLPGRIHSRDIFDKSPSTGTLLSFPSVTDSARSEAWNDEDLAAHEKGEAQRADEKEREKDRGRASKRYPKGAGDDDREESVSLWQRSGGDDDDDDNESSPPAGSPGGIRLVQPRVQNRF
jgi:hypothetical protein